MATTTDTSTDIVAQTTQYLSQIETCIAYLPDAIDAYGHDWSAFTSSVDRLVSCESDCDATLLKLQSAVRDRSAAGTVPVRIDDLSELYSSLEEIPNRAEQFVVELSAMQPTLDVQVHETLQQMATDAVEATCLLTDVLGRLVTGDDDIDIADDVDAIAAIESQCDRSQRTVLRDVFETTATTHALVVRELLDAFDALMDAIEDAAQYLLSIHSSTL